MSEEITLHTIVAHLTQKLVNRYVAKECHLRSEVKALQYRLDTLELVWESLDDHPNLPTEQLTSIGNLANLYSVELHYAQLELKRVRYLLNPSRS
jgi:uncharacterized protein VirK/YbjX